MKDRLVLIVFGVAWLAAVVAGLRTLVIYEDTPGPSAVASVQWPVDSRIQRPSDRATLVMLAHPQCPCTRASIGELNSLMARCHGKVAVYVLFFKPRGFSNGWEKTDLWRSAEAIPGVHVLRDDGGLEARRFRASTSGQTLLFDRGGRLIFSGGITGGRGHSGDNAGRDAVVSLLTSGKAKRNKTFVFGCSLRDSESKDNGN